jgi:HEAT repeat protein
VRKSALWAVGELGDRAKEAAADLVAILGENLSRDAAASALTRIGKPAVPELIKGLRSKDLFVRQRCAIVLGEIGPDARPALPLLRNLAVNDPTVTVRDAAEAAARKLEPAK